jgi:hypothetical protein
MTLRDRNIPAITLRHMHRAERAGGAECKGELSPGFQLGGKVFSLDIPSYRTTGWDNFFGSPKIYWGSRLVNITDMLNQPVGSEYSGTRMIFFPPGR